VLPSLVNPLNSFDELLSMATTTLNPRILRLSQAHEVTEHLRDVLRNSSEEWITTELLELIATDSIAPTAFAQWLGIAQSPETLRAALTQTASTQVRKFAFKKLRKSLSSAQWRETWDALGGVPGWLGLLSEFSVQDVKAACRVLGRSAAGADVELKRECYAGLFVALLPQSSSDEPSSAPKNEDRRKLRAHYQTLIPACTSAVVSRIVAERWDDFKEHRHRLLLSHADTLQELAIQHVFGGHPADEGWFSPLLSEYPNASTAVPGMSASMQFSLNLLERLTKEDARAPLGKDMVVKKLAEPLLKKALMKKIDWSITKRIVDLFLSYLSGHPETAETLTMHRGSFVHMMGRCWSSRPDMFADQFERILALPFTKIEKGQMFSTLADLTLPNVVTSRRYDLLRFYCQCLYQCDLDNETEIRAAKLPPLTSSLLNSILSKEDALVLFTRMRSARGDNNLVDQNAYFYGDSHAGTAVDVEMWHALLLFRSSRFTEAEKVARRCFETRKVATISSAGQEQRASNARSAIDFATLGGSLELCMEAHQWARRFVRDPLTARELYRATTREGVTLLSGIPGSLSKNTSFSELRHRVEYANKIVLFMFETTCLALREPSFNKHHFQGALAMFGSVVKERMKQAARFKSYFSMSDDEVHHILWAHTLEMLLTAEKKALSAGHENLSLNTVGGVLNYMAFTCVDLEDEEPATFRFFDEFAKARDELWRKHRLSAHPATAALPAAFPRGLPVQHLIEPYVSCSHNAERWTPYIASRIQSAVFPDRNTALVELPEDQEMRAAIGTFIDDYHFALRTTVPKSLNRDERKRRIHQAWSYAIGSLSEGRCTPDEAVRYWGAENTWNSVFPEFWPSKQEFRARLPEWPLIPEVGHPDKVEEWNPIPAAIRSMPGRSLDKVTYIDISKQLSGRSNNATVRAILQPIDPIIPAVGHDDVFSSGSMRQAKSKPAIRDAQIMLAFSYIDTLLPKSRLLNTPFPATNPEYRFRYPAVYLDGEFLSRISLENCTDMDVFGFMNGHLPNVPPSLLAQAAHNAYDSLRAATQKDHGYNHLEHRTLQLVRMLTHCDRPTLASDLVVRIVLDRPQNSSWHRQLLSHSFLRRLSAGAAQECIRLFAKAVISKLEQQAATNAASAIELKKDQIAEMDQDRQGLVKVTTVKLLAQLLGDTECLPEKFALSVLSEIITKASHIDIRRAAVSSLLNLLNFASFEQTGDILTALETTVPIAGNLRERRLITDSDWADAENTLELPELENQGSFNESAPILWSLLSFFKMNPPGCPQFKHQAIFFTRIILPIVTSLKYQTTKWTSLFLKKHGFDFAAQQDFAIPQIPRGPQILYVLLRFLTPYLPSSFLDELLAYWTFNIAPPTAIAKLNERLRDDGTASIGPAERSWLAHYALGVDVSTRSSFRLTLLLDRYTDKSTTSWLTGEITIKTVQEAYLKLYTVILLHDTEILHNVDHEQHLLWPFSTSSKVDKSWETTHKPLVEAIILYVESLRTREWERDPSRHPHVLPNTFTLRMYLLQYAARQSDHPPHSEEHCAAFATRVAKLIDQISHGLYHNKLLELKDSLKYVHGNDRLRVACHLGDISNTRLSWLTLRDQLRVELAASLLYDARDGGRNDALSKRVESLRQSWRASESEEVRRAGYRKFEWIEE
jgi:hypothetical protein